MNQFKHAKHIYLFIQAKQILLHREKATKLSYSLLLAHWEM